MSVRFVDLFCGIGGIRIALGLALRNISLEGECVLSSDIDPRARETYSLNFSEVPQSDIRQIMNVPKHDVLLAGFPCQPFSYAGSRRGFGDTRGTLFFEIERILQKNQPSCFILENVRGLTTHDSGRTLATIISRLEAIGYGVTYRVLNSADYGVPQNRMRIYIVGILGAQPELSMQSRTRFVDSNKFRSDFPTLFDEERATVRNILESTVEDHFWCSPEINSSLQKLTNGNLEKLAGYRFIDSRNGSSIHSWDIGLKGSCTYDEKSLLEALISNRRKHKFGTHQDGKALSLKQIQTFFPHPKLNNLITSLLNKGYLRDDGQKFNLTAGNMSFEVYKILDPDSISVTIVTSDAHKLGVIQGNRLRRLTPREVARLQGFPDSFILHPSEGAAYRQLGNSVSIPVVQKVLESLFLENPRALQKKRSSSTRVTTRASK